MPELQADHPFMLACELAHRLEATPLKGKVWSVQVDKNWRITINGTDREAEGIPPFTIGLDWRGLPAGLVTPFDGVIAAGGMVNEASLMAALRLRLES